MGSAMARVLFDIERPTVGLLNIGVEEVKGLEQVREAGRILREGHFPHFDYHGFVEGDDIGKGTVDVVVTEGFAGNIALKTAEGTARQFGAISAQRHEPHLGGAARLSAGAPGVPARCARRWIRANPMAACFSASTASSSRAMAAPTPRVSPRPSTSATTWCATNCSPRSARHGARLTGDRQGAAGERSGLVTVMRSVVLGCGSYLPSRILTNDELARSVQTTDEWIVQRTGIRERHIAAAGRIDLRPGARRRARGAEPMPGVEAELDRPDRAGDLDPRPDLPGDRGLGAGRARHHPWRGLRPAGGLLGLRFCAVGRRRPAAHRRFTSARW